MISYGAPPLSDEIEVTIFGPGYGEAIAVHLNDDTWALVDSCIDPDTRQPAQLSYLRQLGIDPSKIRTIVASHWHDDHVRGISILADSYPNAEIIVSSIFNKREALAFLAAYSGCVGSNLTKGTKELYAVIKSRKVFYVQNRSIVFQSNSSLVSILATALSPLHEAVAQSIAHLAKYLPKADKGIGNASELPPNFESVAIHIDFGSDAILLGSDLEEDAKLGWSAILADKWSSQRKTSSVYKVAHHGSHTGDTPDIWSRLLIKDPIALMTPFVKGKHKIPESSDTARINSYTPNAYISSIATKKPKLQSGQLSRLSDVCKELCIKNPNFGAVRIRRKNAHGNWTIEKFGAAAKLQ
jgi:beta-lactamase superfamily II metal-dependent hydrolase